MVATSEDSGRVAATVRSVCEVGGRWGWGAGSEKLTVSPIISLCGRRGGRKQGTATRLKARRASRMRNRAHRNLDGDRPVGSRRGKAHSTAKHRLDLHICSRRDGQLGDRAQDAQVVHVVLPTGHTRSR